MSDELKNRLALINVKTSEPPTYEWLPANKVFADLVWNRRDEMTFNPQDVDMKILIESVRARGIDPVYPLVVSRQEDGRNKVIEGHRRHWTFTFLGYQSFPCMVYTGLSPEQEAFYMTTGDREKKETSIDYFKMVKLYAIEFGYGQRQVAEALNWRDAKGKLNLNKAQKYIQLANLPKSIQEEWIKQQRDALDKTLTMPLLDVKALQHLYAERTADYKDHPEAKEQLSWVDGAGPRLSAAVAELLEKGPSGKAPRRSTGPDKTVIQNLGDGATHPILKEFLWALGGKEGCGYGQWTRVINDSLHVTNPVVSVPIASVPVVTVDDIFGDETVDQEPVDQEPVDQEPVDQEPVDQEPVDQESVDQEQVDQEQVDAEPVDAEQVDQEPVDQEQVDAEQVDAEPVLVGGHRGRRGRRGK